MGRGSNKPGMDEEKPKLKAEKVSKSKKIQKKQVTTKRPAGDMELEGVKGKFDKKYDEMIAKKERPTKITKPQFEPTARPNYKPDTLKNFEKQYDASVSTKSIIVPGMSKGQKRRTIKKDKIQKKKLFQQYLENLKNKKSGNSFFSLGDIGNGLNSIEFDLGIDLQKEEQNKHKGVSSSAKHNIGNEEILRTQKILQHQTFLNNPLAVIKQHIVNSINLKETEENKKKEEQKNKGKKKGFNIMQME